MAKDEKKPLIKRLKAATTDPAVEPPVQEVKINDFWDRAVQFIDFIAKPLIIVSIVMFLVETEMSLRFGWENSLQSPRYFLWSERAIAGFFTFEIIVRWWRSNPWYYGAPDTSYPFNIWGLIDFIAIVPFWVGFFCPIEYLGLVRTLRVLRALKFFRYSRELQLTALKFYRAYHNLKGTFFSIGIMWLFFAIACLELERKEQPEDFGGLLDVAWFTIVTGTTVGYGDMSPVTIWGKIFVGMMLVPVIGSIGMAISAFSDAAATVQALEDDPTIDPIAEWKKERDKMKKRAKMDRDYHMDE